jgi:hypothetical protein
MCNGLLLGVHLVEKADCQGARHQQKRQQRSADGKQKPTQITGTWSRFQSRGFGRTSIRVCHRIHE